jgi:hypothetical protein
MELIRTGSPLNEVKHLLHVFLTAIPWVDFKVRLPTRDGADRRAEVRIGIPMTSWRPSRKRYRKSATAAPSVSHNERVPVVRCAVFVPYFDF